MRNTDENKDLALRAAWLSYIGGYTQNEIAQRLGVSRMKAHRLIAQAYDQGLVQVFVHGQPASLLALEDKLTRAFGLDFCIVAPSFEHGDWVEGNFPALGASAARFLRGRLESQSLSVLGVCWGRSLGEMAKRLPSIQRPDVRVVSIIGSLTRKMAIHPLDVAHKVSEALGGEAYFLPLPLVADSVADKEVLMAQRSVRKIYSLAMRAELSLIGIGLLEPGDNGRLIQVGEINAMEARELREAGAIADLVGQFIDASGNLVDCEVNRRTLSVNLSDLRHSEVVAVAGGEVKTQAIIGALRAGVLSGLITDEGAAVSIVKFLEKAGGSATYRKRGVA